MIRADVLYLISENPEAHGVFDAPATTRRMVYCTVSSVSRTEVYLAKGHGLDPEFVFELSDFAEYQGEKIVEYNGVLYDVIRTYVRSQSIEITVARR